MFTAASAFLMRGFVYLTRFVGTVSMAGFDRKIFLIANCEFFHTLQSKESEDKEYAMNHITCYLLPFAQTLNICSHLHSTVQSHSTLND